MSDIFEKIARREIPARIVWEDERHIAFLDIRPMSAGHTLVIPKQNIGAHIFDLSESDYVALMKASKTVANHLQSKLGVERVFVIVEGLEVPHVHVKLIPYYGDRALMDMVPMESSAEELDGVWVRIKVV